MGTGRKKVLESAAARYRETIKRREFRGDTPSPLEGPSKYVPFTMVTLT